jgi:hypothetical protein
MRRSGRAAERAGCTQPTRPAKPPAAQAQSTRPHCALTASARLPLAPFSLASAQAATAEARGRAAAEQGARAAASKETQRLRGLVGAAIAEQGRQQARHSALLRAQHAAPASRSRTIDSGRTESTLDSGEKSPALEAAQSADATTRASNGESDDDDDDAPSCAGVGGRREKQTPPKRTSTTHDDDYDDGF